MWTRSKYIFTSGANYMEAIYSHFVRSFWRLMEGDKTNKHHLKWNFISSFWRLVKRDKTNKRQNEMAAKPHFVALSFCRFSALWKSSPELHVCLQIVGQMYLLEPMQRELKLIFHRNDKLGYLEQFCRICVYFHFRFTYMVFANLFEVREK